MVEIGPGAWYTYTAGFLAPEEATARFDALRTGCDWVQRPIVVAGREVQQPRLVAWGGPVPYRYSGQTLEVAPLPAALGDLPDRVHRAAGVRFNHVLLNLYRDGKDNIGFHADDEPELGWNPVIAAVSLGVARRFVFERKGKRRGQRIRLVLEHGSLLVMGGATQHAWYHAVPKEAGCEGERINVTFRWLGGPPGTRRDAASPAPAAEVG